MPAGAGVVRGGARVPALVRGWAAVSARGAGGQRRPVQLPGGRPLPGQRQLLPRLRALPPLRALGQRGLQHHGHSRRRARPGRRLRRRARRPGGPGRLGLQVRSEYYHLNNIHHPSLPTARRPGCAGRGPSAVTASAGASPPSTRPCPTSAKWGNCEYSMSKMKL